MQVVPATCPVCGGQYDPLRSRAVKVIDGRVRAFCSEACKDKGLRPVELVIDDDTAAVPSLPETGWRRPSVRLFLGIGISGAAVLVMVAPILKGTPRAAAVMAPRAAVAARPPAAPSQEDAMKLFAAQTSEDNDVWVHPITGPRRRLPDHPSRRFGADRPGDRPGECREGHCGVDLGRERGELVVAVHDGVIERVQRDAEVGGRRGNEGRFIRINHKGGTVVSSYIHLDGVRSDLRPGVPVKAGEAIGTIGATGVNHSGPHLHFAISVRATPDGAETFIDPEPLLHLWPVKQKVQTLRAMEPAPRVARRTAQVAADASQGM